MARWPELVNQLAHRFRDASRTSQVTWVVAASLFIAALAWSWQSGHQNPHTAIFGGRTFTSHELTEIEASFAKAGAGLNDYEFNDGQVCVPLQSRSTYIAALVDNNALPIDLSLSDQPATSNPFETKSQREARSARNRERQFSAIIRSLNGIDDAAVHFDEEVQPGFHRRREVTAMVAVRPTPGHTLDAERVRHIQNIVAGARIGLAREQVTIADLNTGISYPLDSAPNVARLSDAHYRYEQYLSDQIASVLGFIPDVHIATTAEMQWSPRPHHPEDKGLLAAASSSESLTPRCVSVSIGVPTSYFVAAWRHGKSDGGDKPDEPTPTSDELATTEAATQQRIIEAVRGALPARLVDQPGATKITVTSFQPTPSDGRLAVTPKQESSGLPPAWISAIVGLVAIVALAGSLIRGVPDTSPKVSHHGTNPIETRAQPSHEDLPTPTESVIPSNPHGLSPEPTNDDSMRQSLTAAVQDDPQAAAEALRRWIGSAA